MNSLREIWPQPEDEFGDYQADEAVDKDSLNNKQIKTVKWANIPHYFQGREGQKEITCHDPKDRVDLLLSYLKSGKKLFCYFAKKIVRQTCSNLIE